MDSKVNSLFTGVNNPSYAIAQGLCPLPPTLPSPPLHATVISLPSFTKRRGKKNVCTYN